MIITIVTRICHFQSVFFSNILWHSVLYKKLVCLCNATNVGLNILKNEHNLVKHIEATLSIERNPFLAQNQILRSYRVYISPTK